MALVCPLTKFDWCTELTLSDYLRLKCSKHEISGDANVDSEDVLVQYVKAAKWP